MKKNFEFTFCNPSLYIVAVVQALSRVQPFVIPWTAALQASLFFTISRSLLKLMFIGSVMPSNHSHPLLLPSIFSSVRVFSNESVFRIRWYFTRGGAPWTCPLTDTYTVFKATQPAVAQGRHDPSVHWQKEVRDHGNSKMKER